MHMSRYRGITVLDVRQQRHEMPGHSHNMRPGLHTSVSVDISCKWLLCLSLLVFTAASLAAEPTAQLRVRRYVAFQEAVLTHDVLTAQQRVQINTPDQRMTLALMDNTELGIKTDRVQLQRGEVESRPGSWVRLTRTAQGTQGLIFDGHELYVVAPKNTVSKATAATGAAQDTVVYKLADAAATLPANWCGNAGSEPQTGMQAYEALATELATDTRSLTPNQAAELRLELQLVADSAFRNQYANQDEALNALLVRINNVDGIFSNELGLRVQATDVQIMTPDSASLSTTTKAGELLESMATWRDHSPVMGTYPLTHLVTGRNLDGDTLGIAYVGQICGSKYGVSLSQSGDHSAWIDSLVMAHELAHQLGAVHDGTGHCADTPDSGYLMSAWINGNSEFSSCSHHMIQHKMTQAACLVPSSLPVVSNDPPKETPVSQTSSGGGAWQLGWLGGLMLLALQRRRSASR